MLVTEKISDEALSVKCNYSEDYVERFHEVPGAYFDKIQKRWIVPIGAFFWFEETFKGEIIYKTPKWIILEEPMPDYTKMYRLNNKIILPELKLKLYDYQKYGAKFIIDRLLKTSFVICADDVGLGKTPQAISVMRWMYGQHRIKRVLIACKKSLKRQWVSEINKFSDIADKVTTVFVEGDKKKRQKTYATFSENKCGVMVVNYETVMNDYEILEKLNFNLLIIDEAHQVKCKTGVKNNALAVMSKKSQYTVFLTGTPIMSKPDDIFGVVRIADKKYFGKWKDFEANYIKYEEMSHYNKFIGYMHLDELRDKVQQIVIRRTDHEVSLELPGIITKQIECEIDNTQLALDEQLIADKSKYMAQSNGLKKKSVKTPEELLMIIKLDGMVKGLTAASQAVANDPRLFALSKSMAMKIKYCPLVPASYKMSNKTEALIDLVREILDTDEKVIIFSKFERSTRMLKGDITKALGVEVLLYTGAVNEENRELNIETFKNTTDHNILIGTDAMAEGLNLQVCGHCINYDQPYNPAIKAQRAGRCRRIGSLHKTVYVYDLITLDSCDVKALENLEKAMNLFDGIVSTNEAQSIAIKKAQNEEI